MSTPLQINSPNFIINYRHTSILGGSIAHNALLLLALRHYPLLVQILLKRKFAFTLSPQNPLQACR